MMIIIIIIIILKSSMLMSRGTNVVKHGFIAFLPVVNSRSKPEKAVSFVLEAAFKGSKTSFH